MFAYDLFKAMVYFIFTTYLGDMAISALKHLTYASFGDLYFALAIYGTYYSLIVIRKNHKKDIEGV